MSTATPETAAIRVALTAEEKAALMDLLAHSLGETRVEMHRTHTPDFREKVRGRENLLRGLIEKLSTTMA